MSASNNTTASTRISKQENAKMSEVSKFHPYNALWAQLGDLYGAIGSPPKLSKTIVCGTETQTVDKVLNVLTYFIRCGEIQRVNKAEMFDKNVIDDILDNFKQQTMEFNELTISGNGLNGNSNISGNSINVELCSEKVMCGGTGGGLTRTATCLKDLTVLNAGDSVVVGPDDQYSITSKKNDIPNVLIFRDSRFVKQELRIGNFLMDTGIEMNSKQKRDIKNYQIKSGSSSKIKLLVTSPENEEIMVSNSSLANSEYTDGAEEATESIGIINNDEDLQQTADKPQLKTSPSLSDLITANSLGSVSLSSTKGTTGQPPTAFLWGSERVKEGVTDEQWQHIEKGMALKSNVANGVNCFSDGTIDLYSTYTTDTIVPELKRSKSLYTKSSNSRNTEHIKKSKLTRKVSCSKFDLGQPSTSNIIDPQPVDPTALKSYPSLSDLITANSVGQSERLTWGIEPVKETVCLEEEQHFEFAKKMIERRNSGVVFMLGGDNETLINLKNSHATTLKSSSDNFQMTQRKISVHQHHQQQQQLDAPSSASTTSKSGTKKTCSHKKHSGVKFNFEKYPQIATNYMKNKNIDLANYDFFEKGLKFEQQNGAPYTSEFPVSSTATSDDESSECECCDGNLSRILQTPSNATELEFSNDDNSYPTFTSSSTSSSKVTTSQRKQSSAGCNNSGTVSESAISKPTISTNKLQTEFSLTNGNNEKNEKSNNIIQLITLPISKSVDKDKHETAKKDSKHHTGFIPSLFVGITDHYIADMVLQVLFANNNYNNF